ncbi:hypothetical protein GCM10009098_10780 [Rheinheimera aquimaris]|uniref:Uncharacterized protein n=1 Tax=Rheinheimera aquimaris TaxID=412437 RepID=A0ABN1DJC3_9GAMM
MADSDRLKHHSRFAESAGKRAKRNVENGNSMKKHLIKLLYLLLALMLAAVWWGWQAGGVQLLMPGTAWC